MILGGTSILLQSYQVLRKSVISFEDKRSLRQHIDLRRLRTSVTNESRLNGLLYSSVLFPFVCL
jgi:hypothetical protein